MRAKSNTNAPAAERFLESISAPTKATYRHFVLALTACSDVLARHLRECDKAQKNQEILPKGSKKQTRAKNACNRCAELKIKCDSQEPCRHCKRKSLQCKYTRQGYSDPYSLFQIGRKNDLSLSSQNDIDWPCTQYPMSTSNGPGVQSTSATQPEEFAQSIDLGDDNLQQSGNQQLRSKGTDIGPSTMQLSMSNDNALCEQNPANAHNRVDVPTYLDFTSMFDFPFDPENLFLSPEMMEYGDYDYSVVNQAPCPNDESMMHQVSLPYAGQGQG